MKFVKYSHQTVHLLEYKSIKVLLNQDVSHQTMYKSGANGAEWEVRLSENKTSIDFIGKPNKCCKNYLNQFVTNMLITRIYGKEVHCHTVYAVNIHYKAI